MIPRVIAEEPPVVRQLVAVRREGDIDDAIDERQRRALVLAKRVEAHRTVGLWKIGYSIPGGRAVDDDRGSHGGLLESGPEIQRMQCEGDLSGAVLCFRDHVDSSRDRIDDRGAGDPDFRRDRPADLAGGAYVVCVRRWRGSFRHEVLLPDRRRPVRGVLVDVRVEGVDRIVLGRDNDEVDRFRCW